MNKYLSPNSSKLCECVEPPCDSTDELMPEVCVWHLGLDCLDKAFFWIFVVYLVVTVLTILVIIPSQVSSQADVYTQLNNTHDAVYVV